MGNSYTILLKFWLVKYIVSALKIIHYTKEDKRICLQIFTWVIFFLHFIQLLNCFDALIIISLKIFFKLYSIQLNDLGFSD